MITLQRQLQNNIQKDGKIVTDWFKKNDISCSGEKTKLLFSGTRSNRVSKIIEKDLSPEIQISGETIKESRSEKILGILVNNTNTSKGHLYGDDENVGLIPCLSK